MFFKENECVRDIYNNVQSMTIDQFGVWYDKKKSLIKEYVFTKNYYRLYLIGYLHSCIIDEFLILMNDIFEKTIHGRAIMKTLREIEYENFEHSLSHDESIQKPLKHVYQVVKKSIIQPILEHHVIFSPYMTLKLFLEIVKYIFFPLKNTTKSTSFKIPFSYYNIRQIGWIDDDEKKIILDELDVFTHLKKSFNSMKS